MKLSLSEADVGSGIKTLSCIKVFTSYHLFSELKNSELVGLFTKFVPSLWMTPLTPKIFCSGK